MKKRSLIAIVTVILLASLVYAQQDSIPRTYSVTDMPKIERQTNFMGDNVHILLIEDLAEKMGVQVEELDLKLVEMQQKIEELEKMKTTLQSGSRATGLAVQLNEINSELTDLRRSVNDIKEVKSQMPEEEGSNIGAYIIALLGFNGILLILMTGLVIHKNTQKEQTKTLHEYIANCLESGETKQEIKKDLVSEGWASEQVEKAFKEI